MRLSEIAEIVGGRITGNPDAEIAGLAKIEEAGTGQITFLANPKYRKHVASTAASAILIADGEDPATLGHKPGTSLVQVADPYGSFRKLLDVFLPPPPPPVPGIDRTAVIAPTASVGRNVSIGAYVIVGEKCRIGDGTVVAHGVFLDRGVEIGESTVVLENAVIKAHCRIGQRVLIHPGAVIGSDGFGFTPDASGKYVKIPQRGIVVVEDDVEIGANCTIDRATLGETRIGRGVKLDNLVHVAHNVTIGENTVIAAQSGIAGSTDVGRNCVFAGQVGVVGHVRIADRVTVGAQGGVSRSLTGEGQTYSSSPAKEHHRALRMEGALRQLPDYLTEFRKLRDDLDRLMGRSADKHPSTDDRKER